MNKCGKCGNKTAECAKAFEIIKNPIAFNMQPELLHQRGLFRIHRNARETNCRGRELTEYHKFIKHSEDKIALLSEQIKEIQKIDKPSREHTDLSDGTLV